MDPEALCDQALELYNAGDHEQAAGLWRRAADAGSTRACYNLGIDADEAGDLAEAKWWFTLASTGEPPHGLAMNNLAVFLIDEGDLEQAMVWSERDV